MKLVIEINDNEYMGIKEYPDNITSYPVTIHLYDAVRNGTPLPKGHGDLIDRNDLKYEKYNSYAYAIANAPTIIEADNAEGEDVE